MHYINLRQGLIFIKKFFKKKGFNYKYYDEYNNYITH